MNHAEMVCAAAQEEWERHVEEPPGPGWRRIDDYIQGELGLAWGWVDKAWDWARRFYSRNGQFQWCGAFAAYCYGAAGLERRLRIKHFASTNRLWSWTGKRRPGVRRVLPGELQPGDVLVIGKRKGKPWGSHICIVVSVDELSSGWVSTIEGNATGTLPGGGWKEGVVKRKRPLASSNEATYVALYGVRPLAEDYSG